MKQSLMMDKTSLNAIVNGTEKKASRVFTLVIHGLILLSAVLFSIEMLPGLSVRTRHILYVVNVMTVLIFTAEYALRAASEITLLGYNFLIQRTQPKC